MFTVFSKRLTSVVIYNTIRNFSGARIGILGVPFEKGQPRIGVAKGPESIRKAGLIKQLQEIHENMDVHDYGDVSYEVDNNICNAIPNMKNYEHMVPCSRATSQKVADIIKDDRICIALGGDHAIGLATVDGHIKAKSKTVALLWVDAHADLNTNKTSYTGNIHGMPVGLLTSELSDYWPYLPGMDWKQSIISARNIAYIGLRDVDAYERLIIDKLGIHCYGMRDVEQYGINTVVNMALEMIDPNNDRSIHVSFDIDSLDPLEAPSTGTPVRGGLTLREGIHIMETIYRTGRLGAMDLVEVNPSIGSEKDGDTTIEAAIHIIRAACGYCRRGLEFNVKDIPTQKFHKKTSK